MVIGLEDRSEARAAIYLLPEYDTEQQKALHLLFEANAAGILRTATGD